MLDFLMKEDNIVLCNADNNMGKIIMMNKTAKPSGQKELKKQPEAISQELEISLKICIPNRTTIDAMEADWQSPF